MSEPARIRVLDELRDELVAAARAVEAAEAAEPSGGTLLGRLLPGLRGPVPRIAMIGLASSLLLAAVAVAATLVIGRGAPISSAPAGAVQPAMQPVPGSDRLNGLDVADPDGGPSWDVRTSRSRTGAVCATVGQVLDGELGIVGLDRRFRSLPAGAADTCSRPQRRGATLAGARAFRGGGRLRPLTVVNGVASPGVRRAVAVGSGGDVALRLGPGHAFLAVFAGSPEQVRPRVVLTDGAGRRTTLRFADTGEYLTADPSGGAPWTIRAKPVRGVSAGLRCVQAVRERGPDSPQPLSRESGAFNPAVASVPVRCGARDNAFVDIRRFVPLNQRIGRGSWWGLNPARTIAWGTVPTQTARVLVSGPGVKSQRATVDPATNGFAFVLDGKVDPRTVRVTVDGRALDPMAGVVGSKGQRLAPTPVVPPAWRSIASVVKRTAIPNAFVPDRSTVRLAGRADDPTGGPTWGLRAWRGRVDSRVPVRRMSRDLRCFQIGRLASGDRLELPVAGGGRRIIGPGERDAYCNGPGWLERRVPAPLTRIEVDDPTSADPKLTRVVVAGLLGSGVRSARLLGAGAPRPLRLGPDGTYVVVLGPDQAAKRLRVQATRTNGRVQRSLAQGGPGHPCGAPKPEGIRVADPDGAAPWIAGVKNTAARSCSYIGRVIAGQVGHIFDREATVAFRAGTRRGAYGGAARRPAVTLDVTGPGMGLSITDPAPLSSAQIARRTLPGRTTISGVVGRDVTSVTLRTPRDIRTITPVDGAYLAVYDGAFYSGGITVTGHLRNGRTISVTRPPAPF